MNSTATRTASPQQRKFLSDLHAEFGGWLDDPRLDEDTASILRGIRSLIDANLTDPDLTMDYARTLLTSYIAVRLTLKQGYGRVQTAAPAPVEPSIPDGRYCVDNAQGVPAFFKVKNGRSRVFVDQYASDNTYPVSRVTRARVLAAIETDPQAAMLRFGQLIGQCGHCGRTLTDPDSRERGIGPVCLAKLGW